MTNVIGNGLIANSFKGIDLNENCIIMASGVSNSREHREKEFEREFKLVCDNINYLFYRRFVYFSTCSITADFVTPYIEHKIRIENLIRNTANNYLIIRVPQVVGPVNNNTLVSYFVRSLLQETTVKIQKNAKRNLLGISDLVRITKILTLSDKCYNSIINLSSQHPVSALDVYINISNILKLEPNYVVTDEGAPQKIDVSILKAILDDDEIFNVSYADTILNKYVNEIACSIKNSI